ncbi:translation initiation factor IF-2 N-terminal domain-containing protein, partial [Thermincola ferriacetica]|uniref:translation initiation factor IF-2 N-terminal domain-containing protein n=1 Tax=Thermincola ferriacetica TaxID=281456 RepID=UPI001910CF35
MAKMRVYELAKELGLESKQLIAFLSRLGIQVKNHMSALEDEEVAKVRAAAAGKKEKNEQTDTAAEAPKKVEAVAIKDREKQGNQRPQPVGQKPAGQGPRPVGQRPPGQAARPEGKRPAGQGMRSAGQRPAGQRPAGQRPAGQ